MSGALPEVAMAASLTWLLLQVRSGSRRGEDYCLSLAFSSRSCRTVRVARSSPDRRLFLPELFLPDVNRGVADPVLPADVGYPNAALRLSQRAQNLLLQMPLSPPSGFPRSRTTCRA